MADDLARLNRDLAGSYELGRRLGSGGMSTVYLAKDLKHDRDVAIKVLRPEVASAIGSARFLREIQISAQLNHVRIVPLYDSGSADDILYYIMPCVEGESLRDRVNREGPLPLAEALEIARDVTSALVYAHERGVVHCDIKPENILLSTGGAVVADFGIAQALSAAGGDALTLSGFPVGTMGYMSPEQAMGSRNLDGRTDVYALGSVLYEMLVGRAPGLWFDLDPDGPDDELEESPSLEDLPSDIPDWVAAVLREALALRPGNRTASAEELLGALKGHAEGAIHAPGPILADRRPGRFRELLTPLLIVLVVVAGAVGVWLLVGAPGGVEEHPRLAVLPFEGGPSDESQRFADGTAVSIRSRLAGLSGLDVVAYYREDQYVVEELGEGDEREVGVDVEFVRASDGETIWEDVYREPRGRIFQVQADIAERVAEALDVVILAPERERLESNPTVDPEAWLSFVSGNVFYYRSATLEDNQRAILLYSQAVEADSTFGLAYAALAWAHLAAFAVGDRDGLHLAEAQRASDRAYALMGDQSAASFTRGLYFYATGELAQAEVGVREAIRMRPSSWFSHYVLGLVLRAQGKWDEAVATLTRASALDPRGRTAAYRLAETHLWMRSYPEALRNFDRAISLEPQIVDAYLGKAGLLLARDGEMEAAEGVLREAAALTDSETVVSHLVAAPDGGLWFGLLSEDFGAELERMPADTTVDRGPYFLARAGLHLGRGEAELAQAFCDSLRVEMERRVLEDPNHAPLHGMLGIALAGLGRAEEAVAAGQRALEMTPLEADAMEGSRNLMRLAVIYTVVGDKDAALDNLEVLMAVPAPCCRALLRIHPLFRSLREMPRFQALTRASG